PRLRGGGGGRAGGRHRRLPPPRRPRRGRPLRPRRSRPAGARPLLTPAGQSDRFVGRDRPIRAPLWTPCNISRPRPSVCLGRAVAVPPVALTLSMPAGLHHAGVAFLPPRW